MLFADVTGSTALGERFDPERLREVLTTFFQAMREEIEAEGVHSFPTRRSSDLDRKSVV